MNLGNTVRKSGKMVIFIAISFLIWGILFRLLYSNTPFTKTERCALISEWGMFVSANPESSELNADRTVCSFWEQFGLIVHADSTISLLNSTGGVVQLMNDSAIGLSVRQEDFLSAQRFRLIWEGKCAYLESAKNTFVSVDRGNNFLLSAKGIKKEAATKFVFVPVDHKRAWFGSYFSPVQLTFLSCILVIIFSSLFFFHFGKEKLSLLMLLFGATGLALFMIHLDPFPNQWDEQFHALVAKNLIDFPLKPMLFKNQFIPYDPQFWIANHVWLHKQPLFLWQMALSMKIFGVNEVAMRIPNAIMFVLMIPLVYRIASIVSDKKIAWYSAFLFAMSGYMLDLVSGYHIAEHNDVAFIFYVTISIWAYFEYKNGGSSKWLIIIGLASGMAILVKWLPGLLVYSAWVLIQFLNKEKRWKLSNYYGIAKAFLITVLVVLPWQIYILLKFPVESAIEFKLNSRHIFEAVEGHGGGFFYHFDMMRVLYGFEWIFIVVALVLVPYKVPKRNNRISVLFYVIFVYLFFSSVATKMPSFPLISAALVYLALGVFIVIFFEMFFNYFKRSYISGRIAKPIIQSVFIGFLGITVVNIEKIQNIHTYGKSNDNGSRQIRLYNAAIIKQLPDIAVKETVVFNCRSYEGVLIMFYTDALAAYEGVPDEPLLESLIDRGINVSMFDDGYLPDYVQNNDKVYKIREGYRVK